MENDDVLRCPNCGSSDVRVTCDYVPGGWLNGRAECLYCRYTFQFRWEEDTSDAL